MEPDELVLGIDGGGTKTVACLALRHRSGEAAVVGRGSAGPANPQAVGFDAAVANLDRAIAAAFDQAAVEPGPLAAAVVAVAGSDRPDNQEVFHHWAHTRRLAARFLVVHDALPVLAAGTPQGWGVALISGTGSFAFGQDRKGRSARAGGWGFLFGDEGSGYWIAVAGLRAAAKSADGRGPSTQLLHALMSRLDLGEPQQLIAAVYETAGDRARIASLADVVTSAAEAGDNVARQILDEAAGELATMVGAIAQKLGFSGDAFPLALAGGALLGCQTLTDSLDARLESLGLHPAATARVADPALGAVELARGEAAGPRRSLQSP
ncbi:MAG: N-acetylglucosamine kinase [Planctomycetota bacterium]|jgi:N-acetylglucosamine kinase-like BadF-type ATPase